MAYNVVRFGLRGRFEVSFIGKVTAIQLSIGRYHIVVNATDNKQLAQANGKTASNVSESEYKLDEYDYDVILMALDEVERRAKETRYAKRYLVAADVIKKAIL